MTQEKEDNKTMQDFLKSTQNNIRGVLKDLKTQKDQHERYCTLRSFILFDLLESVQDLCDELEIVD